MANVAAYILKGNGLAQKVVPLLVDGAKTAGDTVDVFYDYDYSPGHMYNYDTAMLWGFVTTCQNIMKGYREAGKVAVYLDLAYWKRDRHYKVSVNDRHPTAYFQKVAHGDLRRKRFGLEPKMYNSGQSAILLAGMSEKAAWVIGEAMGAWEQKTIAALRQHTGRQIIYRPKRHDAPALAGTEFCNPRITPLESVLEKSFAVVTHHSNVAVDGLIAGVPAFVEEGAAAPMALTDFSKIETPYFPNGHDREQWLNDLAYCQWSVDELKSGTCWAHLKQEGLVK